MHLECLALRLPGMVEWSWRLDVRSQKEAGDVSHVGMA